MAMLQPPGNGPRFPRLAEFLGVVANLTKLLIRIPLYVAAVVGAGCGSYIIAMVIWRLTEYLFKHCLSEPW